MFSGGFRGSAAWLLGGFLDGCFGCKDISMRCYAVAGSV